MKKEDLKTNNFVAYELSQTNLDYKYYRAMYNGVIKSINQNLYNVFYHLTIDLNDNLNLNNDFVEHVDNQIIDLFEMVPQHNILNKLTID